MTFFCNTSRRFYFTKNRRQLVFWTHFAPLPLNNVTNDSLNLYVSYTDFSHDHLRVAACLIMTTY